MDLFETATKGHYVFPSSVGMLSTEQLWELPLTSPAKRPDTPSLDDTAKRISRTLREVSEESFVTKSADTSRLETMLAVVKRVIEVRLAEEQERADRAEVAVRRKELSEALVAKRLSNLQNLSEDELKAQLASLSAAKVA